MLHPIVIFVQYNIYDSFCCKCGSKEREAPPPRRARAASPSPSCSGKRPKVERWRGVNGLANNGLISQKKIRQAMQTIVGRWPPCHVLQPPSSSSRNRLSHGGRGAEAPVLPKNSKKHRQQTTPSNANHSRTVVSAPRPPAPILQQPK